MAILANHRNLRNLTIYTGNRRLARLPNYDLAKTMFSSLLRAKTGVRMEVFEFQVMYFSLLKEKIRIFEHGSLWWIYYENENVQHAKSLLGFTPSPSVAQL